MPAIGYLMRVGQSGWPGSDDWLVTPVAVTLRCLGRQGRIEGEVHQRLEPARPLLRVIAMDDLHLPRVARRSVLIAICRAYQGCVDHYCAEECFTNGRDFGSWMDEHLTYERSAQLLTCVEKRLLKYGQVVQSM